MACTSLGLYQVAFEVLTAASMTMTTILCRLVSQKLTDTTLQKIPEESHLEGEIMIFKFVKHE
jgi:hypothetical protein